MAKLTYSNLGLIYLQELAKHIKEHFPLERGTGGTVQAKVFKPGQTWTAMLGYVQKDFGKSTFQMITHNVTDLELQQVQFVLG